MSDFSGARRQVTEKRPQIAPGALPDRVARKTAKNRPKSSKIGPEIDPAARGKPASGPSGRLCGSRGALRGTPLVPQIAGRRSKQTIEEPSEKFVKFPDRPGLPGARPGRGQGSQCGGAETAYPGYEPSV